MNEMTRIIRASLCKEWRCEIYTHHHLYRVPTTTMLLVTALMIDGQRPNYDHDDSGACESPLTAAK